MTARTSADVLYDYMMGFVGVPYRYGGNVPADGGVDCSGLVLLYLQASGRWPSGRDASAQVIYNTLKARSPLMGAGPDVQFGDVAFYGSSVTDVAHTGLCLSPALMLEAGGGDATTTTAERAAEQDATVRVRPILYRTDFLGVLRP